MPLRRGVLVGSRCAAGPLSTAAGAAATVAAAVGLLRALPATCFLPPLVSGTWALPAPFGCCGRPC